MWFFINRERQKMPTGIERVLVTGGAGFIGSHIANLLLREGYDVVVLDNLDPQVHGTSRSFEKYLDPRIQFVNADIRDRKALVEVISEVDAIFHQASAVGVGQSMYEISRYVDANTRGTAVLLDILVNEDHNVKKNIVASSMSIYGEGAYECNECEVVYPELRTKEQLERKEWEPKCPRCQNPVKPIPTPETKPLWPTSIYAQTKRHQEEMCLLVGKTYGIPTIALRYFNTYGPNQALSNPYTGVVAIFSSRLMNNRAPIIFEDGLQRRDFVSVHDVARANLLALQKSSADYEQLNIGSGKFKTISQIANTLIQLFDLQIECHYTNQFRAGDIRHCYADISKARILLQYNPTIELKEGLSTLRDWVVKQEKRNIKDTFETTTEELKIRGLLK